MTAVDDEDFALLDAWCDGDRKAGNALFERHFTSLWVFFRNKLAEGAEDVVQQTFLALVESRDRFRREASFRTFLFATARNVLRHELRKRGRNRVEPDFDTQCLHDLSPRPSQLIGIDGDRRLLLEGLRRIPLDYQIALELYHFEGLPARQVGEVIGLPEPATRSRLRRATEALRKVLETLTSSPTALESTMTGLSTWARDLRDYLERK